MKTNLTHRITRAVLSFLSFLLLTAAPVFATANYVYHERTTANPGSGGQYVTTLNPSSAQTHPLRFKVEYQFYTDNARVYYTTDGSAPSGAFGTPAGTTAVLTGSYIGTFGGPAVDVVSATIPAQAAGTTVKYIVSAWHSGGGAEIFANSGEFSSPFTTSGQATVFQYTVAIPTTTIGFHTASGQVGTYYNGGTDAAGNAGPNVGIVVNSGLAGSTVLNGNSNPTISVPNGFTTGFAVEAINVAVGFRIRVFDGENATGTELANTDVIINGNTTLSITFAGIGKSVRLEKYSGGPNYDNLTFGSATVGTPIAEPPGVTTSAATLVTATTATLNATVNPGGAATTAQFEYGTTTGYGSTASITLSPNNGTTAQTVSANITGLTASTLYHFRATGTNSVGSRNGSDLTFTTPAPSSFTFTGSGNWSSSANWDGGFVPPATLPSGNTIAINGAGTCTLDVTQTLASGSSLTVNAGKVLALGTPGGTNLTINPGATLTLAATSSISNGRVVNSGTIDVFGSYTIYFFTNNSGGVLNIKSGGIYTNFDGAQSFAAGGTVNNDGTMNFGGGGNAGTLNNNVGGVITGTGGAQLGNSGTLYNAGSFVSRNSNTSGAFNNLATGTFSMPDSCLFTVLNGGSFINGGILGVSTSSDTFYINGGGTLTNNATIKGNGTLANSGTFTNSGTSSITPGTSPGKLTVTGNLDLGSTTYTAEINGTVQGGTYDWLAVSGAATLTNASLVVNWGAFTPTAGQNFTILTCGSRTGTFASVTIPPVSGLVLTTIYSSTAVTINAALPNSAPTVTAANGTVTVNEGTATSNALTVTDADSNLATVTTNVGSVGVLASATYVSEFATTATPRRFDFDSAGNIYVGANNGVVTKYNSAGTQLLQFTVKDTVANDGFGGLEIGPDGFIYVGYAGVAYASVPRIQKYDAAGNYVSDFGPVALNDHSKLARIGGPSGNFYHLDRAHVLRLLDPAGAEQWRTIGYNGVINEPPNTSLANPDDVAIDPVTGACYVANRNGFVKAFNVSGATTGYFNVTSGSTAIDRDSQGSLWVAGNTTVSKFTTAGIALGTFGTAGAGAGQFQNVNALRFDAAGALWVLDQTRAKLIKFNVGQSAYAWLHTPADGPAGPTTVTITATDSFGASGQTTFTLNVNNVAPTIALTGSSTVNQSATYTLGLGAVTDPGTDTVTAYSINWGDGNTENFSSPISASKTHSYATAGSKTIIVSLTDEDGTHTSGTKTITVNAPPTVASDAGSKLFIARYQQNKIARANVDGTGLNLDYLVSTGGTIGVAVDTVGGKLFWADIGGKIGRANLDGSGVNAEFVTGLSGPIGLAVDSLNGYLYIADAAIKRVRLDGTGLTTLIPNLNIGGYAACSDVALDVPNNKLYYVFGEKVGRANLDGSSHEPNFIITPANGLVGLGVDLTNGKVYWAHSGTNAIGRANLDGTSIQNAFLSVTTPRDVIVDPQAARVFWSNGGGVGRANLDGTGVNESFLTGVSGSWGIAVGDVDTEGTQATRTGTYSDVDGNTVTISADLGTVTKTGTSSGTWTWTYTPPDGPTNLSVTISANDGTATTTTSFTVNVNNVAPTATFSRSAATVNENTASPPSVSFTGQTDPGTTDVSTGLKYSYDYNNDGTWDDGNGTYAGSLTAATKTIPASYFVSPAPSPLVVKGRIIDKDGGFTDYTVSIAINHAPTAINGPLTIVEDFDYGTTAGTLSGNGGAGFSTAWNGGSYTPTGLTFGSLSSVGGAWNGSSGSRNFAATLAAAGPITGDFLFRRPVSAGAVQMFGLGGGNNQAFTLALAPVNDSNVGTMPVVGLQGGGFANLTSGALDPNTTYMYRFSYAGSSITAWILTAAQYDNFAPGGLLDADLNAASIGSGANQVTGRATKAGVVSSNMANLYTYTFQASGTIMDRVRITGTPVGASLVVAENAAVNTSAGTLLASDPDASNTFTYTLVSGTGSADNANFNISGSTLRSSVVFDYETKNSYSIRVRVTDQGGLFYETPLTVTISNVNEAVTDIGLSASSIPENNAANATVGTLSATGLDIGDTYTFTLVGGTGSGDNGSFTISGTALRLTPSANYEVKNSYALRVRATDQGGLFFEKPFIVTITDLPEGPLELWRQANFGIYTNTGNAANTASPDLDPYSNLLEFAFGTDPNNAASGPGSITYSAGAITLRAQPTVSLAQTPTGVDYRAVFGRRKDWVAAGLTYMVQFSADLLTWETSAAIPTVVASDAEIDAVTVPYPFFLQTGEKAQFFRVQVSIQ